MNHCTPQVLLLTSASNSFTATADAVGCNSITGILKVASSAGSTGSINLVISGYDDSAASTGTSLTTLWGTSQMTAQVTDAAKTFMGVIGCSGVKGRYLRVDCTQAQETAAAAFVLLGFQVDEFDRIPASVTKLVVT